LRPPPEADWEARLKQVLQHAGRLKREWISRIRHHGTNHVCKHKRPLLS